MKLYCPRCNSERVAAEEINPKRVSIDEYFPELQAPTPAIRTIEIKCLDCGYSKTQDVSI